MRLQSPALSPAVPEVCVEFLYYMYSFSNKARLAVQVQGASGNVTTAWSRAGLQSSAWLLGTATVQDLGDRPFKASGGGAGGATVGAPEFSQTRTPQQQSWGSASVICKSCRLQLTSCDTCLAEPSLFCHVSLLFQRSCLEGPEKEALQEPGWQGGHCPTVHTRQRALPVAEPPS